MTNRAEIERWFDKGIKDGATHLIVVVDTFDHSDYPVYAWSKQDALEKYDLYNRRDMQRVMEVYDLKLNKKLQLLELRAFHI